MLNNFNGPGHFKGSLLRMIAVRGMGMVGRGEMGALRGILPLLRFGFAVEVAMGRSLR